MGSQGPNSPASAEKRASMPSSVVSPRGFLRASLPSLGMTYMWRWKPSKQNEPRTGIEPILGVSGERQLLCKWTSTSRWRFIHHGLLLVGSDAAGRDVQPVP